MKTTENNSTESNDFLRVGVITSTHGLKGEVKVFPTTDEPNRFDDLKHVYLKPVSASGLKKVSSQMTQLTITQARYFKQFAILKFKGYNRIEDVENWKHYELYVSREDAIPLEEDEYFITDLIGLKVINDDTEEEIGTLTDVLQTGANDVYQVKTIPGIAKNDEILFPAIAECIKSVDLASGTIRVHVMKGLLDL